MTEETPPRTFADVQEWHWREYVEATGLRISGPELRAHLVEIEKLPAAALQAWVSEQALANARSLNAGSVKRAERAMQRGAETVVGKLLANHDARHSATLAWWCANAFSIAVE